MTKMIATILALLILPVPCLAQSLTCGRNVIVTGSTKTEVLAKCGPPAIRQSEGLGRSSLSSGAGTGRTVVRSMETWVYNFGRNRAMRILTFEGEELKKIELGSHGYEP